MSIELTGIATTAPPSEAEIAARQTDPVQPGYLEELALAREEAGFDRVLVAHSSASPDGFTVAGQVLARTERHAGHGRPGAARLRGHPGDHPADSWVRPA